MARPYKLGQRQAATDQTRASILAAARDLLSADEGVAGFTMDTVARQAGVSRMTVYYQFESKTKLLETLCDQMAAEGGMQQMATVFAHASPVAAIDEFVRVLGRFWGAHHKIVRRLLGVAAMDPEIESVIRGRESRRREGLRVLLQRLMNRYHYPSPEKFDETVEMLCAVISFELFHALAGTTRSFEDVVPQVTELVHAICKLPEDAAAEVFDPTNESLPFPVFDCCKPIEPES